MKKILCLALAMLMVLSMAACGETEPTTPSTTETTAPVVQGPASALELMTNAWNLFPAEEKFPAMGGDAMNPTMDAPGAVALKTEDGSNPLWNLYIPDEQMANISDAATLMHMMNAKTFTGGVVKAAEGADVAALAQAIRDAIMSTRWMCGFPERMIVVSVGDYLVVAFGHDGVTPGAGKNISNFLTAVQGAYAGAKVLFDEAIQ